MTVWFADANVFLRFLTVDDEGHHQRAVRLFEAARSGECRLVTGPPVLFELAWTLRAAYKTPKDPGHRDPERRVRPVGHDIDGRSARCRSVVPCFGDRLRIRRRLHRGKRPGGRMRRGGHVRPEGFRHARRRSGAALGTESSRPYLH